MAKQTWLELDDELLLDGVDYRVIGVLRGRTDRLAFQRLALIPQLGGERRMLLQTEEALFDARDLAPDALSGEEVTLEGTVFRLRWDSAVQIERITTSGSSPKFGRGRCAWYVADDDAVAVLIIERDDRDAFTAAPLAPSQIDLRFTKGLRKAHG